MWMHWLSVWHWWILLPWNSWLAYTDKAVKIVALVVGGGWAYMKFARGRIFHTRLEATVSGTCFRDKQGDYVIATTRLKNVGASRADLQQSGTALIVLGCSRAKDGGRERPVDWSELNVKAIFEDHTGVEASETIEDSIMVDLPPHLIAVKLEIRVVANRIESTAKTIIEVPFQASPLETD
jgi:hypothetical protein